MGSTDRNLKPKTKEMVRLQSTHQTVWLSKEFAKVIKTLAFHDDVSISVYVDEHVLPLLKSRYLDLLKGEQKRIESASK